MPITLNDTELDDEMVTRHSYESRVLYGFHSNVLSYKVHSIVRFVNR